MHSVVRSTVNGIALIVAAVCATIVIREHGVGTAKERTVPKALEKETIDGAS